MILHAKGKKWLSTGDTPLAVARKNFRAGYRATKARAKNYLNFFYEIIKFWIKNSKIRIKISSAVPKGAAGAKNLELLPKN